MADTFCKERLLQDGFKGLYKGELPTDDKDMYIFLLGIMFTDLVSKVSRELVELEKKFDSEFLKKKGKSIENQRAKIIKNCHKLIEEYICEIKGFNRNSRKYSQWFKDMNRMYEENNEEWFNLAKKNGMEFIELVNSILIKELLDKNYYVKKN